MSELYESIGRNHADCTVCASPTLLRVAVGDGCAPICSPSCERAWPNVKALLENAGRAESRASELRRLVCAIRVEATRGNVLGIIDRIDALVNDDMRCPPQAKCACGLDNCLRCAAPPKAPQDPNDTKGEGR